MWGTKTSKILQKKWRCTYSIKHNEKCDGIVRRSRSWTSFSQWSIRGTNLHHPPQNGPHTTSNTHENLQFHRKRNCKQYSVPKTIKSLVHVILLYSRSNQTRPFPYPMETRYGKPGRLFYQTTNTALP